MTLSCLEYSRLFTFHGEYVSERTIRRKCKDHYLPSNHKARLFPGGIWVIEVPDADILLKKIELQTV